MARPPRSPRTRRSWYAATRVENYAASDPDAWDRWNDERSNRFVEAVSYRHVPREVYGAADLDQSGRWRAVPQYGSVWFPTRVAAGWAPYTAGRWMNDPYYGWTLGRRRGLGLGAVPLRSLGLRQRLLGLGAGTDRRASLLRAGARRLLLGRPVLDRRESGRAPARLDCARLGRTVPTVVGTAELRGPAALARLGWPARHLQPDGDQQRQLLSQLTGPEWHGGRRARSLRARTGCRVSRRGGAPRPDARHRRRAAGAGRRGARGRRRRACAATAAGRSQSPCRRDARVGRRVDARSSPAGSAAEARSSAGAVAARRARGRRGRTLAFRRAGTRRSRRYAPASFRERPQRRLAQPARSRLACRALRRPRRAMVMFAAPVGDSGSSDRPRRDRPLPPRDHAAALGEERHSGRRRAPPRRAPRRSPRRRGAPPRWSAPRHRSDRSRRSALRNRASLRRAPAVASRIARNPSPRAHRVSASPSRRSAYRRAGNPRSPQRLRRRRSRAGLQRRAKRRCSSAAARNVATRPPRRPNRVRPCVPPATTRLRRGADAEIAESGAGRVGMRAKRACLRSGCSAYRPNTRIAFSRRNFGHTASLNGTFGMSPKMRSSDRPIGK